MKATLCNIFVPSPYDAPTVIPQAVAALLQGPSEALVGPCYRLISALAFAHYPTS